MARHEAPARLRGTLSVSIHGVGLSLESNCEAFLAYARGHLADVVSPSLAKSDVRVRFHWNHELVPPNTFGAHHQRLSRRLLRSDGTIVQTEIPLLPGLQLRTLLHDSGISVDAAFRAPSKWKIALLDLAGKKAQERIFATLIYYLVYFPLLSFLERHRQWYPLHASAVSWPQGAVVLAGLGGVGKSTLTLAFLKDRSARLLSENLILHDGAQVYAFPEPIHLDDYAYELLNGLHDRLGATGRAYSQNRRSYDLPASIRATVATPCLWCVLRQGQELGIEPITTEAALEISLSSDILAKELNEYLQQSAILNLLSPRLGSREAHTAMLRKLLKGIPCYELIFRPGEPLERIVLLVQKALVG